VVPLGIELDSLQPLYQYIRNLKNQKQPNKQRAFFNVLQEPALAVNERKKTRSFSSSSQGIV
jgi:hypothetical protein